jgi:hypothetical protein
LTRLKKYSVRFIIINAYSRVFSGCCGKITKLLLLQNKLNNLAFLQFSSSAFILRKVSVSRAKIAKQTFQFAEEALENDLQLFIKRSLEHFVKSCIWVYFTHPHRYRKMRNKECLLSRNSHLNMIYLKPHQSNGV